MTHFAGVKTGKKLSCAPKFAFQGIKSQNFEKFYKIQFKNQTVFYPVLRFCDNRITFEPARAFLKQFRKINSLWKNTIRNSYSL